MVGFKLVPRKSLEVSADFKVAILTDAFIRVPNRQEQESKLTVSKELGSWCCCCYRNRTLLAVFLTLSIGWLSGCGASKQEEGTWRVVDESELSEVQSKLLIRFEAASSILASSLAEELNSAIETKGHANAIEVCKVQAPAITAEVSRYYSKLRIGRTANSRRNHDKRIPYWARRLIYHSPKDPIQPRFQVRGDSDFRALLPIVIAPDCLPCHGAPDDLAEGVADALAQYYPGDLATGLAVGDLHGWFWLTSTTMGSEG